MKILAICGYSGSGKTTLLKKLIAELKSQQIRLAVIKHTHHDPEIDKPGKDSYELRQSGADQIIVASNHQWALITQIPDSPTDVMTLANKFSDVDLVLVEGFKDEAIDKIICHRQSNDKPLFYDNYTLAIASDQPIDLPIPYLNINSTQAIVLFVKNYLLL